MTQEVISMKFNPDQQPIQRVIGRRHERNSRPLTAEDRAAMTSNARYLTRAPKGVFIYTSHSQMEADRLAWLVDAMVEKSR